VRGTTRTHPAPGAGGGGRRPRAVVTADATAGGAVLDLIIGGGVLIALGQAGALCVVRRASVRKPSSSWNLFSALLPTSPAPAPPSHTSSQCRFRKGCRLAP